MYTQYTGALSTDIGPKTETPAGLYRPISVPLRRMHSVLARRLKACCPPDGRQRGIICADRRHTREFGCAGCGAGLRDCRKKSHECHVAVLDFTKAFDTVSHVVLIDLLR
ncbi:hypothetical protein PYW07_012536 [Mythimna separata]|uniref:Reverse transcriptase domain-containing protein n=1 Tax=Mythimna separata TaxID=271217 RepID=A0AAD7Y857_MYTSE|nr:hypothetical protein PYW07_012536 [Mythimna separata]